MESRPDYPVTSPPRDHGAAQQNGGHAGETPAPLRLIQGGAPDVRGPESHSGVIGVLMAIAERNGVRFSDLFMDPLNDQARQGRGPSA